MASKSEASKRGNGDRDEPPRRSAKSHKQQQGPALRDYCDINSEAELLLHFGAPKEDILGAGRVHYSAMERGLNACTPRAEHSSLMGLVARMLRDAPPPAGAPCGARKHPTPRAGRRGTFLPRAPAGVRWPETRHALSCGVIRLVPGVFVIHEGTRCLLGVYRGWGGKFGTRGPTHPRFS